jgi:hypothetical protein
MKPRNLILGYLAVIALAISIAFWHAWSAASGEAFANTPIIHRGERSLSDPSILTSAPVASAPGKVPAHDAGPAPADPASSTDPQQRREQRRCADVPAERSRVGCGVKN